jgi:ech hydrogenase subunit A
MVSAATSLFLIGFPLLVSLALLAVRGRTARSVIVVAAALLIAAGSIGMVLPGFPQDREAVRLPLAYVVPVLFALEMLLALYLFIVGFRHRQYLASLLVLLQTGLTIAVEAVAWGKPPAGRPLASDQLSVIMALIVGIVGSLIAVFSLGYMEDYHGHHPEFPDRRRLFFFLQFVFLSAMFGVSFSNSLPLFFVFWEITTICSFLLIWYNGTPEARDKAFLALNLNLLGGIAFSGAILYLRLTGGPLELEAMAAAGKGAVLFPATLLAFAGMTKSAQMPFSSWLLGAMVAPTPVSALLHSSTMVKAGVYLILRLAPVLRTTLPGTMVAVIGGLTFLLASLIAISQRDSKRVLAYSTVSNLGLVVLCGGVGTNEAVWAGVLLIIFHAVTKALLFLCVGTIEQKTNSRDIESMSGLIVSMPRLSIMIQIGIAGMFLAPFGMLVSKWAVLKALVDYNPVLAVFLLFGSSATLFFWVKWMGTLIQVSRELVNREAGIATRQWVSMGLLAGITVVLVALYPVISSSLIEPYVRRIYGPGSTILSQGNVVIMTIMLGMVALFPTAFFVYGRRVRVVDPYLGGSNADPGVRFEGAAGEVKSMEMRGYLMGGIFGERRLFLAGVIACIALIFVLFGVAL